MLLSAIIAMVVLCASQAAADTQSVQSGDWSDPATWSTGQIPDASDAVTIAAGDTVTYDLPSSRVSGVMIEAGAALVFDPQMDVTLETNANVIVEGTLRLRPQKPNNSAHQNSFLDWVPYFVHTLRFVDVDERAFVGGGMDPLASDVGLWVMGHGMLDVAGAPKTGWVRLAGAALRGENKITLDQVPVGWRSGDTIAIAPMEHPDVGDRSWAGFEVRTVATADGSTVHLDAPLAHDHPAVTNPFSGEVYTAEVLNLSRNVRIDGTGNGSASFQPSDNGRAHVLIRSAVPQSVQYAELVLLGPRGPHDRDPTDGVIGRYPLHFHHSGDGSRGSLVEGVVVRQSGNRAFVPHASHGIAFRDTVAFDVWEDPYWWDDGESNQSHDILYDRTIAALWKDDPKYRGYTTAGFQLGTGARTAIRNSVAVGGHTKGSGFHWPSKSNNDEFNVWEFHEGNYAHNNRSNGIFVWQNDDNCHSVENFVAFRNSGAAISHGAYNNDYEYSNTMLFENAGASIVQHAGPKVSSDCLATDGYSLAWRGLMADSDLLFDNHSQPWGRPVLVKDCVIDGVIMEDSGKNPTIADFVNCTRPNGADLEPNDFDLVDPSSGMTIRVQRKDGTAYQIHSTGKVTPIAAFYDTGGGDGVGDTEPPTAPSGLTATVASSTQIDLSWTASTDTVRVTGYRIYRDGSPVATVAGIGHSDTGLTADTTYHYEVAAIDAAGNESGRSSPAAATTLADDPGNPAPLEEGDLSPAEQATVTLALAADTYLREGRPTTPYGTATELSVDASDRGGESQALIRFDLSESLAGSEVVSATLTVQTTSSGNGAAFHSMLVAWDEAATWDSMNSGISADDSEAAAIPDFSTGSVGKGPAAFDVTAPVQGWVNGAPNHGWALLPLGSDGWDFHTREGPAPPQLTVTFLPPRG